MSLRLKPTFAQRLEGSERPLVGMWVCSVSPVMAEIAAGSGLDWVMIDAEHSPQSLLDMQNQLQAMAAYPVTPVVRMPIGDPTLIKQVLDLGPQNIIVPMVSTAEQAEQIVRAATYPPTGIRGVGSALARSARWGRVSDYLTNADQYVSVFVQIETVEGAANAAEIAAVEGVDGVFVGPSDLAASMGVIGQQANPIVVESVRETFEAVRAAGKPVGVNAFDHSVARQYLEWGVNFVLVTSDVTLVARGSEAAAEAFGLGATEAESY